MARPEVGLIEDSKIYSQQLLEYYKISPNEPDFLLFHSLQRLNIVHIQNELAILNDVFWRDMEAPKEEMRRLRRTLHDYANAIKDYEYLKQASPIYNSLSGKENLTKTSLKKAFPEIEGLPTRPYESRYYKLRYTQPTTEPIRCFLKKRLPCQVTYTEDEMNRRRDEYRAGQPPEDVSPFVDKTARFLVAFVGGASLVVPMLIMRLHQSLATSLVTTSVAVLLVAGALSIWFGSSNTETMAATATYAAVLVVFVGTSSGST